jgi:hypothetical protein
MEALKRKPVALLVTVVVMVLSTLLSVNRTLGAACQRITDGFYEGVYVDGYKQPGISAHLQERLKLVNGITAVTANYSSLDIQTGALKTARDHLLAATQSADIAAQYSRTRHWRRPPRPCETPRRTWRSRSGNRKCWIPTGAISTGAGGHQEVGLQRHRAGILPSTLNVFPTKFLAAASGGRNRAF